MFRMRAEAKGLIFSVDHDVTLPQFIRADERKLRQVLINLLGNATKFTQHGGVALRVRIDPAGCNEHAPCCLRFEVEDSGPGIAEDEIKLIFEPFQQGASGLKISEGTGLGLSISKRFVDLMSGGMAVISQPGAGSLFTLHAPVEVVDVSQLPGHDLASRPIGIAPGQQAFRILIVEDKIENRMVLSKLLHSLGFQVREAADGLQALEQFNSWQPHFIWMDLRMPNMDGYEATRRIRQMPAGNRVVIVALTASVFLQDREKVLTVGCDDFLRKPFRDREIVQVLSKHLGVRFNYINDSSAAPAANTTPQNVAANLSAPLRDQLQRAVIQGDLERIRQALRDIEPLHPETAANLRKLVEEYQFQQILDWLKHESSLKDNNA